MKVMGTEQNGEGQRELSREVKKNIYSNSLEFSMYYQVLCDDIVLSNIFLKIQMNKKYLSFSWHEYKFTFEVLFLFLSSP